MDVTRAVSLSQVCIQLTSHRYISAWVLLLYRIINKNNKKVVATYNHHTITAKTSFFSVSFSLDLSVKDPLEWSKLPPLCISLQKHLAKSEFGFSWACYWAGLNNPCPRTQWDQWCQCERKECVILNRTDPQLSRVLSPSEAGARAAWVISCFECD